MRLIVGLGNPGTSYGPTRHNAGRMLVEWIARRHQIRFSKKKNLKASLTRPFEWESSPVVLAYPEQFMNVSGISVALLCKDLNINPQKELLVVVDDAALPFGSYRLRARGSDGGHNGLKSIQQSVGTEHYNRLRAGIGSAQSALEPLEDFVLSKFDAQENKNLAGFLERGYEACRLWVSAPISKAMNVVNAG